ncbi:hypothetical protein RGL59_004393 [Vibrio parahaemolyticus]|nr:hypothetical protein [Vibrio parahaemolyticus]EJC7056769.1 hypothetical protein [Vibrio parahaemolyticus]EJC7100101.1 hypothetical protein [Vibrio parahaemolyticus]EJC7113921.1 hypothetical protein [Vibrio parahaemolyticus]EJC7133151.1 hypothetical protein [Vibrio parahaemolyticus]
MNQAQIEILNRVIEQALTVGSDELKNQGWCLASGQIEDALFDLIQTSGLSATDAIEHLLSEKFEELLAVELERKSELLISPYSDMVTEAIKAYHFGFYNICVPSLFSVIEAALMYLANDGEHNSIRYVTGLRDKSLSDGLHWELKNKLFIITDTIEQLFSKIQFNDHTCDSVLNRHVSMHGRRETPYVKADCLKLFFLLTSVKSCYSN